MTTIHPGGAPNSTTAPVAPPDGPVILPFAGIDHIDETSDMLRVVVRSSVKQVRISREAMLGMLASTQSATDVLAAIVEQFNDAGEG